MSPRADEFPARRDYHIEGADGECPPGRVLPHTAFAIIMRRNMIFRSKFLLAMIAGAIQLGAAACYYPAQIKPPPQAKTQTVVKVPYDLTWTAVHSVIETNQFKVLGDDPNHGIVEAEAHKFTLADADCGQMKSVANRYIAEPDPGGSAVYNFRVEPDGPEATNVSINATYSTPLHVPFHPITDFQCVSRGNQETRLLKEVVAAAQAEHRPGASFDKPRQATPGRQTLMRDRPEPPEPSEQQEPSAAPGRPSLLGPNFLKKPGAPEE